MARSWTNRSSPWSSCCIQLGATDIVVSPRYHNIILALMLNKPAFSLSYHEKFASLMSGVGLADYCQDIDHLDIDTLIRRVMELEEDAGKIKTSLERTMEEYRRALQEQYSFMFGKFLYGWLNESMEPGRRKC